MQPDHSLTSAEKTISDKPPGRVLFALSLVPLIMVLGNSMIIPVLPTVANEYDLSALQTGLLITLFSIPAGVIIPLAGILSDHLGRKKIIIAALILYGAGGIISGGAALIASTPYPWIVLGRIIQGIGAAGTAPIAMALIGDLYAPEHRGQALGVIESSNALGKVLSPILGSLLALIVWYALFFAFPLFIVPAIWTISRWVEEKETSPPPSLSRYREDVARIFRTKGTWLITCFLVGALHMFFLFGMLFFLSNALEAHTSLSGVVRGLYLALPLLSLTIVSVCTGRIIQRNVTTMKGLLITGTLFLAVLCFLLAFITHPVLLMILLFTSGIGSGLVLPCLNTLITSAIGKAERGIVTSLYSSVRFLGIAAGPATFGALLHRPVLLFWSTAGVALLLAFLMFRFIRKPCKIKSKNGHQRLLLRPFPSTAKDTG
jgi:ACDE family multidrug resistance protein